MNIRSFKYLSNSDVVFESWEEEGKYQDGDIDVQKFAPYIGS